ncbi:hypothetical protein Pint_28407 [Pistacia integerrima]|uniref:Uncharacterized protein n=1 Tax=Pistacia integerrima TaxID=434235 RepID=A0ACC0YSK5_9ROSI|nr:hypothetical protein Pint_28407 [Pistacia integerrima]
MYAKAFAFRVILALDFTTFVIFLVVINVCTFLQEILGDCGRAAIQTQGSTNNPFGSTFVYGYQNIAFEVMKNGYIATVTLFQS